MFNGAKNKRAFTEHPTQCARTCTVATWLPSMPACSAASPCLTPGRWGLRASQANVCGCGRTAKTRILPSHEPLVHRNSEGALLPVSACMALEVAKAGTCSVCLLHRLHCAGARQQAVGGQRPASPVVQRHRRPAAGAQRYRPSALRCCQLLAVLRPVPEHRGGLPCTSAATPSRGWGDGGGEKRGREWGLRVAVHGGGGPEVGEQGEHRVRPVSEFRR